MNPHTSPVDNRYFELMALQLGPTLPGALAGEVSTPGSTKPISILPACRSFSSAWVVV